MSAGRRLAGVLVLVCVALSLGLPAVKPASALPAPLAFTACRPNQIFVSNAGLQCATLDVPV
jgi:hypothetical protein